MYFGGQSLLKIKRPRRIKKKAAFEFSIKPESPTGVIMYGVDVRPKATDFISIALVDGYVEFK